MMRLGFHLEEAYLLILSVLILLGRGWRPGTASGPHPRDHNPAAAADPPC